MKIKNKKNQNLIDREQLDNIWSKMNYYKIPLGTVKGLLNLEYMQDMTEKQYNFLLMIFFLVENSVDDNY